MQLRFLLIIALLLAPTLSRAESDPEAEALISKVNALTNAGDLLGASLAWDDLESLEVKDRRVRRAEKRLSKALRKAGAIGDTVQQFKELSKATCGEGLDIIRAWTKATAPAAFKRLAKGAIRDKKLIASNFWPLFGDMGDILEEGCMGSQEVEAEVMATISANWPIGQLTGPAGIDMNGTPGYGRHFALSFRLAIGRASEELLAVRATCSTADGPVTDINQTTLLRGYRQGEVVPVSRSLFLSGGLDVPPKRCAFEISTSEGKLGDLCYRGGKVRLGACR